MITARGIQTVHCLCLFFFFLTATVAYPKLRMQCLFFVFFFSLVSFLSVQQGKKAHCPGSARVPHHTYRRVRGMQTDMLSGRRMLSLLPILRCQQKSSFWRGRPAPYLFPPARPRSGRAVRATPPPSPRFTTAGDDEAQKGRPRVRRDEAHGRGWGGIAGRHRAWSPLAHRGEARAALSRPR